MGAADNDDTNDHYHVPEVVAWDDRIDGHRTEALPRIAHTASVCRFTSYRAVSVCSNSRMSWFIGTMLCLILIAFQYIRSSGLFLGLNRMGTTYNCYYCKLPESLCEKQWSVKVRRSDSGVFLGRRTGCPSGMLGRKFASA